MKSINKNNNLKAKDKSLSFTRNKEVSLCEKIQIYISYLRFILYI